MDIFKRKKNCVAAYREDFHQRAYCILWICNSTNVAHLVRNFFLFMKKKKNQLHLHLTTVTLDLIVVKIY